MFNIMLLSVLNDGDKDFVVALYDDYNGLMRGKAMRILGNAKDAEDVVQNVVIKLIRSVDKLKKLNTPQRIAYIDVMTKNACIDFYNKRKRKIENETTFELVENKLMQEDFMELNSFDYQIFSQVDEMTAKIIYQKIVEKETIKEIGERFNLPCGTVSTIINRGKEKIRKFIEENEEK